MNYVKELTKDLDLFELGSAKHHLLIAQAKSLEQANRELLESKEKSDHTKVARYHGRGYQSWGHSSKSWATRLAGHYLDRLTVKELAILSVGAKEFLYHYMPDVYSYPKYSEKINAIVV